MTVWNRRRIGVVLAAAVAASFALAGCTESTSLSNSQGSYVSGDGTITEFPAEERGEPIVFSGSTDAGDEFNSADYTGQIVVVNFWYAACPPCRLEAPWLEELSQQFAADGVTFIGVNLRDDAATSLAFARRFGVTYPSILDTRAEVITAFSGQASATAVPTTIVLDREGRPASRIIGLIDQNILETLIEDALAESASGSG